MDRRQLRLTTGASPASRVGNLWSTCWTASGRYRDRVAGAPPRRSPEQPGSNTQGSFPWPTFRSVDGGPEAFSRGVAMEFQQLDERSSVESRSRHDMSWL